MGLSVGRGGCESLVRDLEGIKFVMDFVESRPASYSGPSSGTVPKHRDDLADRSGRGGEATEDIGNVAVRVRKTARRMSLPKT